jgi:tetratricopeptide (TPR) repeat protein
MEEGDEHFARGAFGKALQIYHEQQNDLKNPEALQEAKCKEALCLASLKRTDEAIRLFQQVEAEEGDRWPVVAGCQLWLLYLQSSSVQGMEAADTVYRRLSSRSRMDKIMSLIPAEIPLLIVNYYTAPSTYRSLFRDPKLVPNLQLAQDIARQINLPVFQQARIKWNLGHAYLEEENYELARKTYAEVLTLPWFEEAHVLQYYEQRWIRKLWTKSINE